MPHQILVASPPTGDAFAITRVESLAQLITKRASKQTYYTIRLLVDRNRMLSAYCAYAYFRWVDDRLDQPELGRDERLAFLQRQLALLEQCYRGAWPDEIAEEERMLIDLVRGDQEDKSGLQSYIRNMFAVMTFDANRRGRVISERELIQYEQQLAMAVTDALHYPLLSDRVE